MELSFLRFSRLHVILNLSDIFNIVSNIYGFQSAFLFLGLYVSCTVCRVNEYRAEDYSFVVYNAL
jgi:hypothetical protein